jgi:hypothetical protein
MHELRYVDTAAEKLIETASRQKFTVSETTHDNESETCVAAGNLAKPKNGLSLFF